MAWKKTWTDEQKATLRRLYPTVASMEEIAAACGADKTICACYSRARAMRLVRRPSGRTDVREAVSITIAGSALNLLDETASTSGESRSRLIEKIIFAHYGVHIDEAGNSGVTLRGGSRGERGVCPEGPRPLA